MSGQCQSRYVVRIPDAPSDQWDAYECIQEHADPPFVAGIIHDDGSGARWVEVDGFETHTILELRDERDTLKMLRETLCRAESAIAFLRDERHEVATDEGDLARIGRIIAEIDRQRPLGPDGKHGDLHTPTCGCDR